MTIDKGTGLLIAGLSLFLITTLGWVKILKLGKRHTDSQEVTDER